MSARDPAEIVADRETACRLLIAMNVISAADRQVLVMRFWGYRSISEIALLLQVSLRTVNDRLRQARDRLTEALSGFTSG